MAENKNKIIVYRDWHATFDTLSDEEAGRLIKHFFKYVNDLKPEAPDRLTQLLFEPIKQTLKRDLKKYEAKCLINKLNGSLGGRPKEELKEEPNKTEPNRTVILETQPNPEKPDSDSDSDSDKKINSEEKLNARSLIFKTQVLEFKDKYPAIPTLKEFYEYWSEPNKSKTKMRFELEKTWELSRRLNTWVSREKDFTKNGSKTNQVQSITIKNREEYK